MLGELNEGPFLISATITAILKVLLEKIVSKVIP